MDNDSIYSLKNITNNSSFDFLNLFKNNDLNDNDINDDNDSPYNYADFSCTYMDETKFIDTYKNCKKFSYMSLNIQSLP